MGNIRSSAVTAELLIFVLLIFLFDFGQLIGKLN